MGDIVTSSSSRHRRSSFLGTILLFNVSKLSLSTLQATPALKSHFDCSFHHNHLRSPSAESALVAASHSRHQRRYYYHLHHNCHIGHTRHSHNNAVSRSAHLKKDVDSDSVSVGTSLKSKQSQPQTQTIEHDQVLLLGLSIQELSNKLQGSGRALAVWDCLRLGLDPNLYYSPAFLSPKIEHWNGKCDDCCQHHDADGIPTNGESLSAMRRDDSDDVIYDAWIAASSTSMTMASNMTPNNDVMCSSSSSTSIDGKLARTDCKSILPGQGRSNRGRKLGYVAWNKLQKCMTLVGLDAQPNNTIDDETTHNIKTMPRWKREHYLNEKQCEKAIKTIDNSIASLSHLNVSSDGTTKLLLKMKLDGLEVESVIIPWTDKGFSTLCVSSQVGCRQGCTFCATGRMGKLRSLTTDEILVQLYYAAKVCRIANNVAAKQGDKFVCLPKVDNIVFMGMGEPADNAHAVVSAVQTMVDRSMFGLAQSKITISTVAPDPSAFAMLGQAPAALAWSVHAVDDVLRRRLVPTTKYAMEELRVALVNVLQTRANKLRRMMLEVALIKGVNDSYADAIRLAEFSRAIMNDVEGSKVVVNLIPYNAIDHPTYSAPSKERVMEFQKIVTDSGILCYVRTTRGDDESAACGQLATKRGNQAD